MTHKRTGLPVVALLGAALAACGGTGREDRAASAPAGPIVAAVVRSDGVLVPFATFESGRWTPAPDESVADRPAPWFTDRRGALATWAMLTPLGLADARGEPLTVRATGEPVQVASHCQLVWGLSSDLPGTPVSEHQVHRNVGIAFAGDVSPALVVEADTTAANDDRRALAYLTPLFDAAEAREAAARSARAGYEPRPVGASAAKAPLALTRLHRVGRVDDVELYLFEAVRRYAPARSHDCDAMTVMTGWLAEGRSGALSLVDSGTALTDCDRKGSAIVQPMAVLNVGPHLVVFTVDYDYENESYSIFQAAPATVTRVLSVDGGGC